MVRQIRIVSCRAAIACFSLFAFFAVGSAPKLPDRYNLVFESSTPPLLHMTPDKSWIAVAQRQKFRSVTQVTQMSFYEAVGIKLNNQAPVQQGLEQFEALQLIHLDGVQRRNLNLPEGTVTDLMWSPDSRYLALVILNGRQTELWKYDLYKDELVRWVGLLVSVQFNSSSLVWTPDSQSVIVRASEMTPRLATSSGSASPIHKFAHSGVKSRVYRDLLDSTERKEHFRSLTQQRAVQVFLSGEMHNLGSSSMLEHISVSPSGQFVLLTSLHDSLAGNVKFNRLGRQYQIINLETKQPIVTLPPLVANVRVAKLRDAAAKGPRMVNWVPHKPATLYWANVNVQPNGQPTEGDRIFQWEAPFNSEPELLGSTGWRAFQLNWTDSEQLIINDWNYDNKQVRLSRLLQDRSVHHILQYNYRDKLNVPGELIIKNTPTGLQRAASDLQGGVYVRGHAKAGADSQFFIDLYPVEGEIKRVFHSDARFLERPLTVVNQPNTSSSGVLFIRENSQLPPRLMYQVDGGSPKELKFRLRDTSKTIVNAPEQIQFERHDGRIFFGELYLPAQKKRTDIPLVIWLYPRYSNEKVTQRSKAPSKKYNLIHPSSPLVLLLEGVAVLDLTDVPIVEANGVAANFAEQLKSNMDAVFEGLKEREEINLSKVVLMGHSFGAASVATLLANTSYFSGGIARSGAYNRSLTPLGFQEVTKTLWQAKESYLAMSPFFQANEIDEPLLLIHGAQDQNPGTSLLQSEMMFEALQANHGNVELLVLPHEGHSYIYRENIESMLEVQRDWLLRTLSI